MAETEKAGDDAAREIAPGASFDTRLRETVEQGSSAWNRGDLDSLLAMADHEFEYSPELDDAGRPIFPGLQPVYRGHEEIRRHLRDWASVFEGGVSAELVGVAYGTGCVAALTRFRAQGRGGVTTEREIASAIEVRDGLIRRWRNFVRWEDALAALGMPAELSPGPP
jgi:ketosteroid isomerase-like protein